MPLPYSCYLGNFPYINSNVIIDYSNLLTDKSFENALLLQTQNLRISTNSSSVGGLKGTIQVIYHVPQNQMDFISFDSYNAIVLTNSDKTQYLLYRIINIEYVSSVNISIIGEPTVYNMLKNISPNTDKPTNAPINILNSIAYRDSFIEWGYKYDSIITTERMSGRPNFSLKADTDLYCPLSTKPELNILNKRVKLEIDYDELSQEPYYNPISNVFNNNILSWVIVYIQSGTVIEEVNETTESIDRYTVPQIKFAKSNNLLNAVSQPYGILCAPIYKSDVYITTQYHKLADQFSLKLEAINSILSRYSAQILQVKIVPFIPFTADNFVIDPKTGTSVIGVDYDENLWTPKQVSVIHKTTAESRVGVFSLENVQIKEYRTLPFDIFDNENRHEFLKFFDEGTDYEPSDLSTQSNPYIFGNVWKLKVDDCFGNSYDYEPIKMGELSMDSRGLIFSVGYSFEIGISNYYVYLNTELSGLNLSLYSKELQKTGCCAIGSNDMTILFAIDKLDEYLANNKNFYTIRGNTYNLESTIADEQMKMNSVNNNINMVGQTLWGLSHARSDFQTVSALTSALSNAMQKQNQYEFENRTAHNRLDMGIVNSDLQMENLAYAPDRLNKMNSNFITAIAMQEIGFYCSLYTCKDIIKQSLLNEFICKGINLNRFASPQDIQDYMRSSDLRFDKKYRKYVKGNIDLYCKVSNTTSITFTYNDELLEFITQMIKSGVIIIKPNEYYPPYPFDNSTYENYLSTKLDESTFND